MQNNTDNVFTLCTSREQPLILTGSTQVVQYSAVSTVKYSSMRNNTVSVLTSCTSREQPLILTGGTQNKTEQYSKYSQVQQAFTKVVQYSAVKYRIVQCNTAQCRTVQRVSLLRVLQEWRFPLLQRSSLSY